MRTALGFLISTLLILACGQEQPAIEFIENKKMLSPEERWGELFTAVQTAGVFPDGKTFVDCEPKYPTDQILSSYSVLKDEAEFHLRAFVLENFDLPPDYGSDFTADPSRAMGEHIGALWPVLTRQPDEANNGSLIRLPHPYIVPGGRFREIYYWDSYFTMLGLQVDGQDDMIENMVRNFAHLIDTIGFIPNGNRTYFQSRSQPPFFASMVGLLAEIKGQDYLIAFLPQLIKEYEFWMRGTTKISADNTTAERVVQLDGEYILNRYYDNRNTPRPESYREDVETAEETDRPANDLYRDLRAACESGWDFSSRWLSDGKSLHLAQTTLIIPVDLNALLYNLEKTIAQAYAIQDETAAAETYNAKATARAEAIQQYCWDEESGFYRDYNILTQAFTPVLSMAAAYPLFFKIASQEQAERIAQILEVDFLRPGGFTSTLEETGQQWDAPNGWAPLQWMAYQGLKNYGLDSLANTARDRWLNNNEIVYQQANKMVEKYNVDDPAASAGGGEYPLQDGFGWSNGVAKRFLVEKAGE
ncbi:MAG: alpha,alpha-trehalase TreF [Bacteroidota bacterium]